MTSWEPSKRAQPTRDRCFPSSTTEPKQPRDPGPRSALPMMSDQGLESRPWLVIPAEIAVEVLDKSETVAETENLIREEIGAGVHPLEVWQKYGRF